ncbi:polyprenyl synthetase family protein [Lentilactobacillus sp. Marseille-Q4993]|uniref:polyprenyl synthetase family protein n=1 Tax=Lentilactobacillus sp. Marseille-Q4993 TaxID=3039492 RepID=UPI0024BC624B|nr:farnesyl diphosphate synthase [Lentilactobacillus sp. Marseille-Q4993]
MKISAFEDRWIPIVNEYLDKHVNEDTDQRLLADAMDYSVEAGGKRLRPLMAIAGAVMLGVPISENVIRALSAVELLHTYSLIHDDLPAMDDDDLRRGKPSNHVKFGEDIAILAGDGLQALAFQWVTDNTLPDKVRADLARELAIAAGPAGMVAGQVDDVSNENHQLSLSGLQKLHRNKTGALIHYAVNSGMIVGNANEEVRKSMLAFADKFGLAFQIYDDILDVTSSSDKLGKPVHQDGNKNTYPNLLGLSESKQILTTTVEEAKTVLTEISSNEQIDTSLFVGFCDYFKIEE